MRPRLIAGFPRGVRARLIAGYVGIFLPISALGLLALLTLGAANAHTHELYQHRLVSIITLSQTVENLDQMRQMVVQDVLTTGQPTLVRAQHQAIAVQLATLDAAIERTVARYALTPLSPRPHAVLRRWPVAWRAFRAARGALLRPDTGGWAPRGPAPQALTVTLNDRLNTVLDLVYALMGDEQREGQALDQAQQDTYRQTAVVLVGGLVLIALCGVGLAVSLTRSVARLYDEAAARARYDTLTGLPNRAVLHDRLAQAVRAVGQADGGSAGPAPVSAALLLLDLDRFKQVNDTHGHLVGSRLLAEVGDLMRRSMGPNTSSFRYGGDEFVVLLPAIGKGIASEMTVKLHQDLRSTRFLESANLSLQLSGSFGLATYPQDGDTVPAILRAADTMMYEAKVHRDTVVVAEEGIIAGGGPDKLPRLALPPGQSPPSPPPPPDAPPIQ